MIIFMLSFTTKVKEFSFIDGKLKESLLLLINYIHNRMSMSFLLLYFSVPSLKVCDNIFYQLSLCFIINYQLNLLQFNQMNLTQTISTTINQSIFIISKCITIHKLFNKWWHTFQILPDGTYNLYQNSPIHDLKVKCQPKTYMIDFLILLYVAVNLFVEEEWK